MRVFTQDTSVMTELGHFRTEINGLNMVMLVEVGFEWTSEKGDKNKSFEQWLERMINYGRINRN